MRILHITPYFYPSYRGQELTVLNLSVNTIKLGHQVSVLTVNSEGVEKECICNGIRVYRCIPSLRYRRGILSMEFFKKIVEAEGYDIYHIHIPFHSGLDATILASKLNNIPIVANHHGEGAEILLLHAILSSIYNCFYRNVYLPHIERIIFFSRSYPDTLKLSKHVNEKIRVVKPAVDPTMLIAPKEVLTLRRNHGFKEEDKIILSVSTFPKGDRSRGLIHLLKAMQIVKKTAPDAKLLIVGGGSQICELKRLASKLEVDSNVIFVGYIEHSRLASYYAMSEIFILPSTYESFGYVVLEAMSFAKPVIVSDIPGVGELVEDGATGFKIRPGNYLELASSILLLLDDYMLRHKMGYNAHSKVEGRTWLDVAQEVEAIYYEVLYTHKARSIGFR